MAYTTITFLVFAFLVVLLYYIFPVKKYQWVVLLAASFVFYLWTGYRYAAYILFTTATVWLGGLGIEQIRSRRKKELADHKADWEAERQKKYKAGTVTRCRALLALVLVANFGILSFLKYFNFLAGSLGELISMTGIQVGVPQLRLILPLGISFYTFQSTGYLIDVYRQKAKPEKNPAKFALFVSFFPQIIQGPISIYGQLAHQLYASRRFSFLNFKYGIQLIIWGYFKKMVIADRAVAVIDTVMADISQANGTVLLFTVLTYALQLYADFSGGIDITRGLAQMLGIDMAENFRRPYFATSINGYWKRWHITLGGWLKNYVFYSLAMSKGFLKIGKKMKQKMGATKAGAHVAKVLPTCVASLITFLIVGIWHGANWKYVAFGVWNGGVIMLSILLEPLYALWMKKLHIRGESFGWRLFQIFRTFLIVLIGYVFDIAAGFKEAMVFMGRCITDFSLDGNQFVAQLAPCGLEAADYVVLLAGLLIIFIASVIQEKHKKTALREMIALSHPKLQWMLMLAGIACIALFGVYGPGYHAADFVYMQF